MALGDRSGRQVVGEPVIKLALKDAAGQPAEVRGWGL